MSLRSWSVSVLGSLLLFNVGCGMGFFTKSSADSKYQPGLETPGDFTKTWTVGSGTSSDFTLSSNTITYTSNTAELRPIGTDSSDDAIGFGSGTKADTDWNITDSLLELNAAGKVAKTGSFISRIFSANASINWTKLGWISSVPAGKAYPNNKAIETAYDADNIDMSNNVLLLHMDEASWNGTPGEAIDSSGSGNHGNAIGINTMAGGFFNRGGDFGAGSGQHIEVPDTGQFNLTDKVTVEAWVYPQFIAGDEFKFFGIVTKRTDFNNITFAMSYLIAGNPHPTVCIDFRQDDDSTNTRFDTSIVLNPNEWSHIAFTFDGGISGERLKVYHNGVLVIGTPGSGAGNSFMLKPGAHPIQVGILDSSFTETFRGKIDEVAMYNRILSEAEIQARYRRGINRLKFQVETCATPMACNGSFVGPDGTAGTYFTEATNYAISNLTEFNLTGVTGNNFRYKAIMENDDGVLTPRVKSVAVTPVTYSVAKPTLVAITGPTYKKLTSFAATTGGTGAVKFQLVKDSVDYYWDGSGWAVASNSTHTNTAAEVNSHIAAFPAVAGTGTILFKAYFESDDGTATSSLTSVTVGGAR